MIATFALACGPLWGWAQKDTVSLATVEVVASPMPKGVWSTGEMQTLGKEDLRDLGIDNVAEAVKRFAGVSVKDYGGIGGMKTVSIHNLGAHHTAVSYDGVTVSNTQAGQIDVGRFDTDNIASLTLYVGDEDNLMLAARQYASAGVLSLQTERPRFAPGHDWAAKVNVTGGSYGLVAPSLRLAGKVGAGTMVSAYGKFTRADGGYPYILHNGQLRTREHRMNTDINAWQTEANLYHTFSDSSELRVKAYWYYSRRGLPGAVILYAGPSEERLWDEDFFTQATYDRQIGQRMRLTTRMKFTHSWNQYRDWGSQYPHGVRTDVNRQNEYYGSATLAWTVGQGLDMAVAQDLSYNDLTNNIYVNVNNDVPLPTRWTSVTAAALKWRTGRLKANGNLAYTYAAEQVRVGAAPPDKRRLTPSVSLNYRLLPNDQLYVRAQWKNTFRVPTFNDLYYRRLGNVNLRPELAHEYSLGLAWNMSGRSWRYIAITADAYYNRVKDKIVAFPSTYVWRMVNYGKVDILGADLTFGSQVDLGKGWDVRGMASATWQHAADKTDKASATYNNLLPYTPQWSGSGSVVLTTPWCRLAYSVVMQGSRYSAEQNKQEYKMRPFWDHSLVLSGDLKVKAGTLHLQLKATNLTDAQYDIIQYYPMPGRQMSVSVGMEL